MTESREIRLKRLTIRSWRRGTREMDLILGPYADGALTSLDEPILDDFEALLEESDQDLYAWVAGAAEPAARHRAMVDRLRSFHGLG